MLMLLKRLVTSQAVVRKIQIKVEGRQGLDCIMEFCKLIGNRKLATGANFGTAWLF